MNNDLTLATAFKNTVPYFSLILKLLLLSAGIDLQCFMDLSQEFKESDDVVRKCKALYKTIRLYQDSLSSLEKVTFLTPYLISEVELELILIRISVRKTSHFCCTRCLYRRWCEYDLCGRHSLLYFGCLVPN